MATTRLPEVDTVFWTRNAVNSTTPGQVILNNGQNSSNPSVIETASSSYTIDNTSAYGHTIEADVAAVGGDELVLGLLPSSVAANTLGNLRTLTNFIGVSLNSYSKYYGFYVNNVLKVSVPQQAPLPATSIDSSGFPTYVRIRVQFIWLNASDLIIRAFRNGVSVGWLHTTWSYRGTCRIAIGSWSGAASGWFAVSGIYSGLDTAPPASSGGLITDGQIKLTSSRNTTKTGLLIKGRPTKTLDLQTGG